MKSLHDYKGEYRAARKRCARSFSGPRWLECRKRAQKLVDAYFGRHVTVQGLIGLTFLADEITAGRRLELLA